MIRNLGTNKILWLLNAILSLLAASIGVINTGIYHQVVSREVLPGAISQDLLTIFAAFALFFFTLHTQEEDAREQIVVLGILGYLFYAYGIYAIERVYNILYFLYLAIFGLSFYSIVYGVATIRPQVLAQVALPGRVRKIAVGFSLFIAALFSVLWIVMLVPLVQAGQRIEFTYSIFILDLSLIMPAFVILAVMAAKNRGLGLVLTPAMYVLGFTLLFPVGLAEFIKPFYTLPIDPAGAVLYFGISLLFLVLAVVYLRDLKVGSETS